jgi:magnesium-transporting ATPase (P-type)
MNNNNLKSPIQSLNLLNVIFYALISGILIFFLVTHLGVQKDGNISVFDTDSALIFNYLVPFICIIQGGLSIFLFDTQMKKMPEKQSLKKKMQFYFQWKIIQWALLDGAALFSVVAYFLTAFPMYALWCLLMMMLFAFYKSSLPNFLKYASLTLQEQKKLEADKFED